MGHEEMKMEMIQCLTRHGDDETHDDLEVKDFEDDSYALKDLTDDQKAGIERGLADIDAGRVHSHEEVKLKYGL
jgi:hypothetical protein